MAGESGGFDRLVALEQMERLALQIVDVEAAVANTMARVAICRPDRAEHCNDLADRARVGSARAREIARAANRARIGGGALSMPNDRER